MNGSQELPTVNAETGCTVYCHSKCLTRFLRLPFELPSNPKASLHLSHSHPIHKIFATPTSYQEKDLFFMHQTLILKSKEFPFAQIGSRSRVTKQITTWIRGFSQRGRTNQWFTRVRRNWQGDQPPWPSHQKETKTKEEEEADNTK